MTTADTWADLGIAPTDDAAAIRRAYAARLKAVRPDADPQGFARLRNAYERALTKAETPVPVAPSTRLPPKPRRDAVAVPLVAPPPATVTAVTDCLRRGDALGAAERLAAAREAGALTLEQDFRLANQLGWALAHHAPLAASDVRAAAERLGWLAERVSAPWAATLRARLDAEQWLAELRRDAASRWVWVGSTSAIAACMMLGRGKLRTLPVMGRDANLRRRYGEFLMHTGVVGQYFDPVRVEAVALLLTSRPDRLLRTLRMMGRAFPILCFAGAVAGGVLSSTNPTVAGTLVLGLLLLIRALQWMRFL